MTRYSAAQYNEIFLKLPKEIQDIVVSYDTTDHLWKIGEKHRLQVDQIGLMHDIILDVMMGIVATKHMTKEVAEALKISELEANAIVRDIDDEIFTPIKDIMKRTYGEGNPFRPKPTYKEVNEKEEDHIHISRDKLLNEIENPDEPLIKKEGAKKEVKKEIAPTTFSFSEEQKARRERLLGIISDKQLAAKILMSDHLQTAEAEDHPTQVETAPILENKTVIDPIIERIEAKKPPVIVDPFKKETPTVPNTTPQVPQKNIIDPFRANMAANVTQTKAPQLDPYREQV